MWIKNKLSQIEAAYFFFGGSVYDKKYLICYLNS
jgi:hypothetical protein